MNVYYLLTEDKKPFFYFDESEDAKDEKAKAAESATGLWGWAERKLRAIQKAKDDPKGGLASWLGRFWDWLHTFSNPDETMLTRFGSADGVDLHYPESQPIKTVQKAWKRFLGRRSRRHAIWMTLDAVLAPFGIVLAILPGPNVIGYWLVYRAFYHFLAVRGIRRVRKKIIPTNWHAEKSLDAPVSRDENGKPRHEALAGAAKLEEYLHWFNPDDRSAAHEDHRDALSSHDSVESEIPKS